MTKAVNSPWLTNSRAEWDIAVHNWLTETANTHDLGSIQTIATIKERPWSIVFRVNFTYEIAYFKACGAGGYFEPQLLQFLASNQYIWVPELIAVDIGRGWLLMKDMGDLFRESATVGTQLVMLQQLFKNYGLFQKSTLDKNAHYFDLGLPDRRSKNLPLLLENLLIDERLHVGHSQQMLAKLRKSVRQLLPHFEEICREMKTTPYAAALDHGDLHMGNILAQNGNVFLSDWGDACVTHPFCSIMVTLGTVLSHVPFVDREAQLRPLLDAYLAPWEVFASRRQLQRDFQRAVWAAYAVRTLNLAHMVNYAPPKYLDPWLPLIAEWLEYWVRQADLIDLPEGAWVTAILTAWKVENG